MPISRAKKELVVEELTEKFGACQSAVFVDYRGLTVKQMQALRKELREVGSELIVAKNRLMNLALGNTGLSLVDPDGKDLSHLLTGVTAVAFGYDNPSSVAKVLLDAVDDYKVQLKGGFYGTLPVEGVKGVERISKMRSKEDALADLVRIISPATALRPLVTVAKGAPGRVRIVASTPISTLSKLKTLLELDSQDAA